MMSMRVKFIINKSLQAVVMLIVLSIVIFALAQVCPGDPLKSWYGDGIERMSVEQKEQARENLGLNKPAPQQYFIWAKNALSGNWGISFKYKRPVKDVISSMAFNTFLLATISIGLIFILSIWLGRFCALRQGSATDRVIRRLGVVVGSIPVFFLAILLLLFFAVKIPLFPTGGAYSYGNAGNPLDVAWHLALPVFVLVIGHLWYYSYLIRNKLTEEAGKDYVLLCRAKGLTIPQIMKKHCMKNCMPAVLTVMALAVPHILGETYVTEMVFSSPGLGTLSLEAAKYHDYNMLLALSLITGAIVLAVNLAAQIISEMIDPRMDYSDELELQDFSDGRGPQGFSDKRELQGFNDDRKWQGFSDGRKSQEFSDGRELQGCGNEIAFTDDAGRITRCDENGEGGSEI